MDLKPPTILAKVEFELFNYYIEILDLQNVSLWEQFRKYLVVNNYQLTEQAKLIHTRRERNSYTSIYKTRET